MTINAAVAPAQKFNVGVIVYVTVPVIVSAVLSI